MALLPPRLIIVNTKEADKTSLIVHFLTLAMGSLFMSPFLGSISTVGQAAILKLTQVR